MLEPGTEIEMTKGYKGSRGFVMERMESEFYMDHSASMPR